MAFSVISPGIYTYGAMVIGGMLEHAGFKVSLRHDLSAPAKDTVFLSLFSTMHLLDPGIRAFIAEHRRAGGTCYIGGPVSACPDIVLGELAPDAVVLGEGEETVIDLASNGLQPGTPGVAVATADGVTVRTRPAPAVVDHPLPFIPDDIGSQSVRGASAYIETHRGCIGACTFCQVPRFFGREVRSRSIESIMEEVRAFKAKGAQRLSISGGTGSLFQYRDGRIDEEAFVELLRGMASVMGANNVSSPDIRVDCISDTVLDAIRDYTIGWVFFGIESGSPSILRLMGKGATVEQAEQAVEQCRDHGLKVAGSFIVGYPTETKEDYEATRDFISAQCLDDVFISIAEPIPGTPLAELVLRTSPDENPTYQPHTGEYRALGLTESEARSFDLMMHADLFKPGIHVVTDEVFNAYLANVRKDGQDVRAVTELLVKYRGKPD